MQQAGSFVSLPVVKGPIHSLCNSPPHMSPLCCVVYAKPYPDPRFDTLSLSPEENLPTAQETCAWPCHNDDAQQEPQPAKTTEGMMCKSRNGKAGWESHPSSVKTKGGINLKVHTPNCIRGWAARQNVVMERFGVLFQGFVTGIIYGLWKGAKLQPGPSLKPYSCLTDLKSSSEEI